MSTVGWAVSGIIPRGCRDMDRMLEKLPVICLSGWVLLVMGMGGDVSV